MVLFTLIALGVLVTFHEYGHFWVARKNGVKVLRFSIGFGTPLLRWHDRHGTEFVVAALPLGGYVKMLDEREGDVAESELPYAFNRKSVWQRMAVVVAGPLANFLLAILVYWVVFAMGEQGVAPVVGSVAADSVAAQAGLQPGQEITAVDGEPTPTWRALRTRLIYRIGETGPITFSVSEDGQQQQLTGQLHEWLMEVEDVDPVGGIGLTLYQPAILPIADEVLSGEPAARAGMQPGDRVLSVDGIAMATWGDWVDYVRARPGETLSVEVEREGVRRTLRLVPQAETTAQGETIGKVGMSVVIPEWPEEMLRTMEYGFFGALGRGLEETKQTSLLIVDSLKKMIQGLISVKHLSGPITIAKVAGASAQHGVSSYLAFIAFLSVSLGVLNLLPIPVLDGGHLMYYLIEAVKGRPVSEKAQMLGFKLGLMMVVGLMVLALYNDLMRL